MKIKWPILIAIFAIPLLIVFVLHNFGENRFDVPVYFQDERPARIPYCGYTPFPYYVNSTYVSGDSVNVLFLSNHDLEDEHKLQFLRIRDRFNNKAVRVVLITVDGEPVEGTLHHTVVPGDFVDILQCQLILEAGKEAVLLDSKKRIRGYYDADDREDVDRLAVETEIVLTNDSDQ